MYKTIPIKILRSICLARGIENISGISKAELIKLLRTADINDPSWLGDLATITLAEVCKLSHSQALVLFYLLQIGKLSPPVWTNTNFPLLLHSLLIIRRHSLAGNCQILSPSIRANDLRTLLAASSYYPSETPVDLLLLTKAQLKEILLTNSPDLLQQYCSEAGVRFRQLETSSNNSIVCRLFHHCRGKYGKYQSTYPLSKVAHYPSHPLEKVINNLNSLGTTADEEVGMVIPTGFIPRSYVYANIHAYGNCYHRDSEPESLSLSQLAELEEYPCRRYLSRLTDSELFHLFNCQIHYTSRVNLVEKLQRLLFLPQFFSLQQRCPAMTKNTETTLLTSITDEETLMLAFGTALCYRLYEIAELNAAFAVPSKESLSYSGFAHPENNAFTFSDYQIYSLQSLGRIYPTSPEIKELQETVTRGLQLIEINREQGIYLLELFSCLPEEDKIMLCKFLRKIFAAGMYMRRWRGPGHPYPHRREETLDSSLDVEKNTATSISKVQDALFSLSVSGRKVCSLFNRCTYNSSTDSVTITPRGGPLMNVYQEVCEGTFCIRQASSLFVFTSSYYLSLLYDRHDLQFNPKLLASVE